jgi:CheY-like chemotaxis protein
MKHVLIVDSSPDIRAMLTTFLSLAGYTIQAAMNYSDAMMILRDGSVDIMICDHIMPNESFDELVLTSRQASPKTCVVVLSAWTNGIGQKYNGSVDHVLQKPMCLEALAEVLPHCGMQPA